MIELITTLWLWLLFILAVAVIVFVGSAVFAGIRESIHQRRVWKCPNCGEVHEQKEYIRESTPKA